MYISRTIYRTFFKRHIHHKLPDSIKKHGLLIHWIVDILLVIIFIVILAKKVGYI